EAPSGQRLEQLHESKDPPPPEQSRAPFMFAFEKLPGLPRDRLVEAIAPVLRAHGLAGVELIWRTDGQGRVLQVTVENAAALGSASLGGASLGGGASEVDGKPEGMPAGDGAAVEGSGVRGSAGVGPGAGVTLD